MRANATQRTVALAKDVAGVLLASAAGGVFGVFAAWVALDLIFEMSNQDLSWTMVGSGLIGGMAVGFLPGMMAIRLIGKSANIPCIGCWAALLTSAGCTGGVSFCVGIMTVLIGGMQC
jgi:hypothetical protein